MLPAQKERKKEKQERRRLEQTVWRSCKRKDRFDCQSDATKSAKRKGLRAYECPFCGGWHLTKRANCKSIANLN